MASVNIFGGFAVTARMLAMYKKKERSAALSGQREAKLPRWRMTLPASPAGMMPSARCGGCHALSPWVALAYLVAGMLFILACAGCPRPRPRGAATASAWPAW